MNKLWLAILETIVTRLVSTEVMKEIKELVLAVADTDLPGPEKRLKVQKELEDVKDELKDIIKDIAPSVLNLAIETAVVLVKNKK